jgi:hypothetical protein
MQFFKNAIRTLAVAATLGASVHAAAGTINDASLRTWWHITHELNATTPVADNAVRRSTFYDAYVGKTSYPLATYDSFTYMSIPRGGRDKWLYTTPDGAEFADAANLTMSWTTFQYSTDAFVDIKLKSGTISSANDVTIRPSNFNLAKQYINPTTIRIFVPYAPTGYHFSVEFNKLNQVTTYNDLSGDSGVLNDQGIGRMIHTEPRNAMMVFAEPMLSATESAQLVPSPSSGTIHYVQPGLVNDLHLISKQIVYFGPGVYYMPWDYHAKLPAGVKWVYLAPGAYVKGAFQFTDNSQSAYKVTGYGVISGEKYVYEADTNNSYKHQIAGNCWGSCVKLLRLESSDMQQYLYLHGVTFNEPPYHSFVVYGNENTMQMQVAQFKQVGAWYWQTDGPEVYTNGTMANTFIHSNDDVIKMYHPNVNITNTVIWKGENGPVVQWGWKPRNVSNVNMRDTYVIHNRMAWKDEKGNTCLINAAPPIDASSGPNAAYTINHLVFENFYVEGKTNCAIRIYALANTKYVHLKNFTLEGWNDLDMSSQASRFTSQATFLTIGNENINSEGLKLENYSVGGQRIYKAGTNWDAVSQGRLNFDPALWDNWNAW